MGDHYERMIAGSRIQETTVPGRDETFETLSDKARILTCTAFRRLQTKAQVFSLEQNAGVRTRLTHTLEVSIFGELIANKVADNCIGAGTLSASRKQPFVNTVQNACLLHDIGNPPFGHLGEFAISDWFSSALSSLVETWNKDGGVDTSDLDLHKAAFTAFDGNPQGIRIVTRLQWLRDEWGLNLTKSLIASGVKYLGSEPLKSSPFGKKAGYFETERKDIIEPIWSDLGLKVDSGRPAQRHPLAFIMEAADDIAYSISDIEDAIEKGVLPQETFLNAIPPILAPTLEESRNRAAGRTLPSRNGLFLLFKTHLARTLVEKAAAIYQTHEDAILNGTFAHSLLDSDQEVQAGLQFFKDFAREHIYACPEAVNVELSGYHIIQRLLEGYRPLLSLTTEQFQSLMPEAHNPPNRGELAIQKRLFTLLPKRHLLAYRHCIKSGVCSEIVARLHLVVDYISGMTDGHALRIFKTLTGNSEVAYS